MSNIFDYNEITYRSNERQQDRISIHYDIYFNNDWECGEEHNCREEFCDMFARAIMDKFGEYHDTKKEAENAVKNYFRRRQEVVLEYDIDAIDGSWQKRYINKFYQYTISNFSFSRLQFSIKNGKFRFSGIGMTLPELTFSIGILRQAILQVKYFPEVCQEWVSNMDLLDKKTFFELFLAFKYNQDSVTTHTNHFYCFERIKFNDIKAKQLKFWKKIADYSRNNASKLVNIFISSRNYNGTYSLDFGGDCGFIDFMRHA